MASEILRRRLMTHRQPLFHHVHDVEGRFVRLNEAAERASGKSNTEWLATISLSRCLRRHVRVSRRADRLRDRLRRRERPAAGRARAQHLPQRFGGVIVGVLILAFDARRPASELIGLAPQARLAPRQREILDLIARSRLTRMPTRTDARGRSRLR